MLVWHYTWGHKWPYIQRDGVINVADGSLGAHEKPVVWFSARSDIEPTAQKRFGFDREGRRHVLTLAQQLELCNGAYRIGVDRNVSAPYSFVQFRKLSGISTHDAKRLIHWAREWGAFPGDWWVSFKPVPQEHWVTVEYRDHDAVWRPVDFVAKTMAGLSDQQAKEDPCGLRHRV